ncbi:MAG: rubrerythrin [Bacteroidetes bacterium GWE2_42_24]|nr:MAG: rubrerythrin [Bacteroidetes bacterium GWE2_42_24]OFY27111.1 MAG: rubrerythrin [Bacteroidetes bacterium GWF2_43_11]HCU20661.1 rubrerythrin [Bacteroidales bacterium]
MPDFGSPFTKLASCCKLTDTELVGAIRFMVAAEYEATQLYLQIARPTGYSLAINVLKGIADKEVVHAGEFLLLLRELAPNEKIFYVRGVKSIEERILKAKIKKL